MDGIAQYEVLLVPAEFSLTDSQWTWRRFEKDGSISAHGLGHDSMNACFFELRQHKALFGEATITVNLRGEASPKGAAPVPRMAVERHAPVLSKTHRALRSRAAGRS